ncbi:hypothetical protein ANN_18321 [Periplaneta americana]|uniref:Uncharacterized protein n=1 Tax=Periplaneta americana TaxID=6978 RepID=A0ABQ8SQI7_PERAM|nr:hypothetical protein ANN_18321 [Periplaneta americana]
MAGLCEGSNEPPGSIKATLNCHGAKYAMFAIDGDSRSVTKLPSRASRWGPTSLARLPDEAIVAVIKFVFDVLVSVALNSGLIFYKCPCEI